MLGRIFDRYKNELKRVLVLPGAYIAPEGSCVPRSHVQLDISPGYTDENVLHIDKCVQLDFPVVSGWTAWAAGEPNRAEDRLIVNLELFIRCEAVIQQLNIWPLVIQIPSEGLLAQEYQLCIVRYLLLLKALVQIQSFQHSHWVD